MIPFQHLDSIKFKIQETPLILQKAQSKFFEFLEELILGLKDDSAGLELNLSESFTMADTYVSRMFNNMEIDTGVFDIPYVVTDESKQSKITEQKRIFTLYAEMDQTVKDPTI